MDILEELYLGNIRPSEREFSKKARCSQLLCYIERHTMDLNQGLTDAQREIFEKYQDCARELQTLIEQDAFADGFRLGGQFMLATLDKTPPET